MTLKMETRVTPEGVTVVSCTGRIVFEDEATTLRENLKKLLASTKKVVMNLSGVSYTSSAGLRALLATVKQARSAGGDFRLAAVMPPVHKVLEMSGFTTILKLYPDVELAIASFPA